MRNFDSKLRNEVLDDIIISRRTIRTFRPDASGEDMVHQIITAGLHAPYTKSAVENFTEGYFRRFFVMRTGGDSMATTSGLLNAKVKELAADLEKESKADPAIEEKSHSWTRRLKWFQDLGHLPGVTNAPYYTVLYCYRGASGHP